MLTVRYGGLARRVYEMMDYNEREPSQALTIARMVAGEWYLRGLTDAYNARAALIPFGPAGEQYIRGYEQGLAAVQRDFFAAMCIRPMAVETATVSIPLE